MISDWDFTTTDVFQGERVTFPFFETESGVIVAKGHVDKAGLVELVEQYDILYCGEAWRSEPGEVQHAWAIPDSKYPDEAITWGDVTQDTPGAFPISILER